MEMEHGTLANALLLVGTEVACSLPGGSGRQSLGLGLGLS